MAALSTLTEGNPWLRVHASIGISPMDKLFGKLAGLYQNRWAAQFKNEAAVDGWKEAWSEGFAEDGISPQEVKVGIANCRRSFDWPPSYAEFVKACRPGLDAESAFSEACEQMRLRLESIETGVRKDVWSHPAIYWAAAKIGTFDLRNASWQSIKGRWTAALQAEYQKGQWADIPAPALALPAPGQSTPSKEVAAERAAMLKQVLNGGAIKRMEEVQ